MKRISWNIHKNRVLVERYGSQVCFENVVAAIEGGGLLDDIEHPNQSDYAHQRMFVVLFDDYVYAVPYVEDDKGVFLKTVYPSRRLKAVYLPEESDD